MAARRGKALKLVLEARKRIRAVATWKRTKRGLPGPKAVVATRAMTVGPPEFSADGTMAKAWATMVTPTKMTPRRMAIAVIVLAALRDSGGLNAGTPLAMASTPVRATDPPAKALRMIQGVRASLPGTTA